jgi:hypothetical protein
MSQQSASGAAGFVFAIWLVGSLWKDELFDRLDGYASAYTVVCDLNDHGTCRNPWRPGEKWAFNVMPAQDRVVYREAEGGPVEITSCVVADRLNWVCVRPSYDTIRMRSGILEFEPFVGIQGTNWLGWQFRRLMGLMQ